MNNKKKKALKRERNLRAKLKRKQRKKLVLICSAIALTIVVTVVAVIMNNQPDLIFKYDEGAFIDPKTNKTYCPADTSAYLIKTEFYERDYYGKMDGDKVYTIPGVKNKSWLVRCLTEDLFQLYHEESVLLPTISEFEPTELYLFVDAPVIFNRETINNKTELESIVSILTNGERVEDPGEFTETFSMRFVSDKYSHMYFCFEYVVTDSGTYFYDHLSATYTKTNGVLDSYVASLKENSSE